MLDDEENVTDKAVDESLHLYYLVIQVSAEIDTTFLATLLASARRLVSDFFSFECVI